MDQTINPIPIEPEVKETSYTWLIILTIIFLTLAVGVAIYQNFWLKKQLTQVQPSPSLTPLISPSPILPSQAPVSSPSPSVDPTADWKTFSVGGEFPLTFQYPNTLNVAGKNISGQSYHVFISNNAISVPDTWDSPITQVELDYAFDQQRSYEKIIQDSVTMITPETLRKSEMIINQLKMSRISGTVGPGYMEGEKITYVVIDTPKGPVSLNYFQSLFKNQKQISESEVEQILSTFKFTD